MLTGLKECVREIVDRRLAEQEADGVWQPQVTRREVVEELREGVLDVFAAMGAESRYRFVPAGVNQEPAIRRKEG